MFLYSKKRIEMKEQNIFIEEENQAFQNYEIQFIDDEQDPNFILQFLQLKNPRKNLLNEKDRQLEEKNYIPYFESFNFENYAQGNSKSTSNFHNFQKHLVYTLRNSITLCQITQSPELFEIQSKLWKQFLSGKKATKMLIYITLGAISYDCKVNQKLIRKHGFQKLYKQYNQNQIKAAQNRLKKAIITQLKELDLNIEVHNRKIQKKEQFKTYFQQFLLQISSGNFSRRYILKKQNKEENIYKNKKKQNIIAILQNQNRSQRIL